MPNNIEFTDDIVENQEILYKTLGGENILLEKIDLVYHIEESNLKIDNNIVKCTADNYGYLYIDNEVSENELLYLIMDDCEKSTTNIRLGETYSTIADGIFEVLPGQEYLKIYDYLDVTKIQLYKLDLDKINNLYVQSFNVIEDYNQIKTTVNLSADSTIVLPYVNIPGYSVFIDGKISNFSDKFASFMTIDLTEGEHEILIEFNNPVYRDILIGIAIGLILIGIALLIYRLIPKFNDKCIKIIF